MRRNPTLRPALRALSSRGQPPRPARGLSCRSGVAWPLYALATLAALLLACSPEPAPRTAQPEQPEPAAQAAQAEPTPISGIYDVRGTTVPVDGGDERDIAGTVILRQTDDQYSATFKLETTFPGTAEPLAAEVIGSGDGDISGRTLTGSTKTQLVVSTVPGVDTQFAFIPRIVGARVVSSSVTEIGADGSVTIELENRPAQGEDYPRTRTRLTGIRVADADATRPDVAARE